MQKSFWKHLLETWFQTTENRLFIKKTVRRYLSTVFCYASGILPWRMMNVRVVGLSCVWLARLLVSSCWPSPKHAARAPGHSKMSISTSLLLSPSLSFSLLHSPSPPSSPFFPLSFSLSFPLSFSLSFPLSFPLLPSLLLLLLLLLLLSLSLSLPLSLSLSLSLILLLFPLLRRLEFRV